MTLIQSVKEHARRSWRRVLPARRGFAGRFEGPDSSHSVARQAIRLIRKAPARVSCFALLALLPLEVAGSEQLVLNEQEYLEMPGLNVMLAHDFYPEGHQGGVGIIQNGRRVATNGDLRLEPTPGQWAAVPKPGEREVDPVSGAIRVRMEYPDPDKNRKGFNPVFYPDLEFAYELVVTPGAGSSFTIRVDLEEPLPVAWQGRVGFILELFPGYLFGKSYLMDGRGGVFPRQAYGPGTSGEAMGYQLEPLAEGRELILAPGTASQRMKIESMSGGSLQLLDGRAEHSNGWFVVRSTLEPGKTAGAMVWKITPHAIPGFQLEPVIQVSQVGYHVNQPKIAMVELPKAGERFNPMQLLRVDGSGDDPVVLDAMPEDWGHFQRYRYLQFDFSGVREPGLYRLRYGDSFSHVFQISEDLYERNIWQPTVEHYLPVQMCHMRVEDRYRIWHGRCHLDDARMAPVNHNHFDGYGQGTSTLTPFQPGEIVPGLDRGGWHDAGDYDLRVESQAGTVLGLALAYEHFGIDYDNTTVDQRTRSVSMLHPDGAPDLLQQVEHGVLTVLGGYQALGRFYRGIIVPTLDQYTHLGDAATQTDNTFDFGAAWNPSFEKVFHQHVSESGVPDDRWVFTEDNPRRAFYAAAGLAAAARVLKDFRPELAAACDVAARETWENTEAAEPVDRLPLAVELLLSGYEEGVQAYFIEHGGALTEDMESHAWLLARVVHTIRDQAFKSAMDSAFRDYSLEVKARAAETPYGVPYRPRVWGAGWAIQRFGMRQYFLHQAYPDLFSRDVLFNALNFILGVHPGSNTASFVSGVGSRSVEVAYGVNRADWSFIPGGSASGTALIRPDYPELLEWPYLWQQTEYVMGGGTTDYLFLVLAARDMLAAP